MGNGIGHFRKGRAHHRLRLTGDISERRMRRAGLCRIGALDTGEHHSWDPTVEGLVWLEL